jgi:hypothetical protein
MRGIDKVRLERCDDLARGRGYVGPRGTHYLQGEKRIRIVRNMKWERPATETFDEFIVGHLKYVLGKEWGEAQLALPPSDQHIVIRWLVRAAEYQKTIFPKEHQAGELVLAKPTGDAMELLSLSEDLYRLNLVDRLPAGLLDRLRNRGEFQGVRYEIATAASFVRAGFAIDWMEPSTLKSPEFTATLGSDVLVVEAKSRHRQGFIHQPGTGSSESMLRC